MPARATITRAGGHRWTTRRAFCDRSGGPLLRNAEGLPVVFREVLGQQDDLADVRGVMSELAVDGLHDRVRFSANGDGAAEVGFGQRFEGGEDMRPTLLPHLHEV